MQNEETKIASTLLLFLFRPLPPARHHTIKSCYDLIQIAMNTTSIIPYFFFQKVIN
jgi:hypothetical protein